MQEEISRGVFMIISASADEKKHASLLRFFGFVGFLGFFPLYTLAMSDTSATGRQGEDFAARYLASRGYRIRAANVRLGRYEIDLIADDPHEQMLVFVEVKTRARTTSSYPVRTAVDRRKRRALREAVARWVQREKYGGPGRIDLITVAEGKIEEHIQDLGSDLF
jgi:putative endonuclease